MPRTTLLLIALVAPLVGGCAGGPPAPDAAPAPRDEAGPIGLEARNWRIAATGAAGGALHRALASDAAREPPDAERWSRAGIRLRMIPRSEVDPLEATLPHVDAVKHAALGQPTTWTPLASAPLAPGRRIDTPGGERTFPRGGRLELLVRGWDAPEIRGGASIHVELALAWSPPGPGRPEVVDRLISSVSIGPDEALVIAATTPADDPPPPTIPPPRADGPPETGPRPDEAAAPPGDAGIAPLPAPTAPTAPTDRDKPEPIPGPRPPPPDTIGDLLLVTPAVLGDHPVPARLNVIVLIPARR